jgi:hypothetical protein
MEIGRLDSGMGAHLYRHGACTKELPWQTGNKSTNSVCDCLAQKTRRESAQRKKEREKSHKGRHTESGIPSAFANQRAWRSLLLHALVVVQSARVGVGDTHRPANSNGHQFEKSRRLRPVNTTAVKSISSRMRRYGMAKKDWDVCKNAVAV